MLESKIDDLKNTLPGTATNSIGGVEEKAFRQKCIL